MATDESTSAVSRGDAQFGIRQLTKIATGGVAGVGTEDALAAIESLDGDVALEFAPEGQLAHATLSWTGDAFAIDGMDVPEEWEADSLSWSEASALFDGATLLEPVGIDA